MPKGQKTCSHCGKACGPRSFVCPHCNTPFSIQSKTSPPKLPKLPKSPKLPKPPKPPKSHIPVKLDGGAGRGKKRCGGCGNYYGVRTKVCPDCQRVFQFTPSFLKPEPTEELEWRDLCVGDVIKVVGGTGPYMNLVDPTTKLEEKQCLGYYGKFRVVELDERGIHAYPVKANESGRCYIYMGDEYTTSYGVIKQPHKIHKVKVKQRVRQ